MVKAMDDTAVQELARLLRNSDWRCRLSAIQHLHSVRRRVLEKLGEEPMPTGSSEPMALDDMTPEQRNAWREATRTLLEATRATRTPPNRLTTQQPELGQ